MKLCGPYNIQEAVNPSSVMHNRGFTVLIKWLQLIGYRVYQGMETLKLDK